MAGLPALDHIPTVAEVDRIAALADPVIRNLQITQCYHELALTMAARTGVCANWCTFATWASKQAGQTIRREDLARALQDAFGSAPAPVQAMRDLISFAQAFGSKRSRSQVQALVTGLLSPRAAIERASEAVARGNKKVYEEIGREFARFYATCLHDAAFDAEKIARFCEDLRPGEPPDGQQALRQAFTYYYRAFFESDPKTRAELTLLANIEIGFHEQTRLQPEIAEAIDAALIDRQQFRQQVIKALFPWSGWFARGRLLVGRLLDRPSPLDALIDVLLAEARRRAHFVVTEYLMTIGLPHGVRLRLGDDLPGPFPASLRQIALPDLRALLERLDPTPDSTRDTGAADWASLPDRLHFIIDMFRCYHEAPDLFEAPFSAQQVALLKAGRLPPGRL